MTENVAEELIEDSLIEYHSARFAYLKAVHGNGQSLSQQKAAKQLHVAVVNLYLTLQPFRTHNAIADQWDDVVLWEKGGQPVGLEALGGYIDREIVVEEPKKMRSGTTTREITNHLLPDKALRVGQTLVELGRELGADVSASITEESEV